MSLTQCVCARFMGKNLSDGERVYGFSVVCSETPNKERQNERKCRNLKTSDSIVCALCKSAAVLQGFALLCLCTSMKGRVEQRFRDFSGEILRVF